jgi:hypothetical protein
MTIPVSNTPILFSPENVAAVLADLPTVAGLIPPPEKEGSGSTAFPDVLRKTERELYRWIANTRYDHLAAVVPLLERVHDAGCRFGNLLTTRSREQFVSHTAELLVAEDLMHRGYRVSTIPRASGPSPDLHVAGDGIDVVVEVYTPRELTAIDEWTHEVLDLLRYVDMPVSYRSSVHTKLEQTIPPDRELLDPWEPAKMLEQTHDEVMAEIRSGVGTALSERRPLSEVYRHGATPLRTTIELSDVRTADPTLGPERPVSFSYPGFGGYSPAGVFRTVVERAQKKARKRQAHGAAAAARALVVYMMSTKIAEDLLHPAHMKGAEQALGEVDPQEYGLDAIAFVVRTLPRGVGAILWIADDATLTEPQVRALFDAAPESHRTVD